VDWLSAHAPALLAGGLRNLAAYLAAHVLLCLQPALFIAGAMTALIQDLRPLQVGESVGQVLRPWQVLDPGEDVVDLRVLDAARGELAGQGDRMRLDALGVGQQERLDAATLDVVRLEQLRHRSARHDRQVAAEQHAVEAGQDAVDAVFDLVDESLHTSLRGLPTCRRTSMPRSKRRHLGCGCRPR
jgi:hypothetical protein